MKKKISGLKVELGTTLPFHHMYIIAIIGQSLHTNISYNQRTMAQMQGTTDVRQRLGNYLSTGIFSSQEPGRAVFLCRLLILTVTAKDPTELGFKSASRTSARVFTTAVNNFAFQG